MPIAAIVVLSFGLAPSVFLQLPNEDRFEPQVRRDILLDRLAQVVALSSNLAIIEKQSISANQRGLSSCAFDRISRAIVATEMYNRPDWLRQLEFLYYDTFTAIGLSPPNLSLGVGQVTVPTARETLQWSVDEMNRVFATDIATPTDDEIVDILREPCANAQVVFLEVCRIMDIVFNHSTDDADVRAIASEHMGGRQELIHGFTYDDVVERLVYPQFRDLRFFSRQVLRPLPALPTSNELNGCIGDYKVLACSFVAGNVKKFIFEGDTTTLGRCTRNLVDGQMEQEKDCGLEVHVTKVFDLTPADKVFLLAELFVAREMLEEMELGYLGARTKLVKGSVDSWMVFEDIGVECYSDETTRKAVKIISRGY